MDTTGTTHDVPRVLPRAEWVKTLPQTIVASCVLLLDSEDRILLLRYAESQPGAGTWWLPGGMLDHGEDPVTAAHRELREETGIVLTQEPRFLGYDHRADVKGTGPVIDFFFHGGRIAADQQIRHSPEHDQHGFFSLFQLGTTPLTAALPTLTALHTAARSGAVVCLREGKPV